MEGNYGKIVECDGKPYCDGKELTSILDIAKSYVSKLTNDGVFIREDTVEGKLYDLHFCVQAFIENQKSSTNAEDAKIRRDRAKAETAIKASKAVIAKLEAQELQGKMFRTEDIKAITEDYFYKIRNMLNSLPGQLATDVAPSTNAAECAVIIRTCVNRLLVNMEQYRFDVNEYKERVHERMSWESREEDSDGGEE